MHNSKNKPTPESGTPLKYNVQSQAKHTTTLPLTNYSLSSVCPACNFPTVRRACKVRCDRCGFMWDCSEL